MDVAHPQIIEETKPSKGAYKQGFSFFPRLSLRGRVIALITLLVATIVGVYTFVNIANLTSFLITRTKEQTDRLSKQISYAAKQDLVLNDGDRYVSLAKKNNSSTRELMESTIASLG